MSYVQTLKKMLKSSCWTLQRYLSFRRIRSFRRKDWGKRRLAYEIEDFKEGFYNIVRIKTDNNRATDEFQRLAKISDDIIRYIVIREDQDK